MGEERVPSSGTNFDESKLSGLLNSNGGLDRNATISCGERGMECDWRKGIHTRFQREEQRTVLQ